MGRPLRWDGPERGLLAGTRAEVALYELRQSIDNGFNGAMNGVPGLRDLGFTVDPATTHVASVDTTKLDAILAHNRDGALAAINEFGDFSKSAELLVSANNFIPQSPANLDRVIDYISDRKGSLRAEFGLAIAAPVGDRRAGPGSLQPDVQGLSVIGCASATAPDYLAADCRQQ